MKAGRLRIESGRWHGRAGGGRARGPREPRGGALGVTRPTFRIGALPLRLCISVVMLLFGLLVSQAQSYSLNWHKISGGGGTSSNGQYTVSGTIGQHDAGGPMLGGNYSLTGGFWALISVVQTPGAPTLHISHAGNIVTVYWPDVSGWHLQQNNNLATPAGWADSAGVISSGGTNYFNVTPPTGNLFFRLTKP